MTLTQKIQQLNLGAEANETDYKSLGLTTNDVRFLDLIYHVMRGENGLLEPGEPIDFIDDFAQLYGWNPERIALLEDKDLLKSEVASDQRKLYTVTIDGRNIINREYPKADERYYSGVVGKGYSS